MSVSVVIVAWNEEQNLPRAVRSARKIADEVVVVDTESTDATAEIARRLDCRVYSHPNTGIVEPVRNFSIGKARGDWVFLLDADEEIPDSLARRIKQIVDDGEADYCRIPRKNIIFGRFIQSHHWWPDYVYRFFRKGAVTWEDTIHSIPLTVGRGIDLPADPDLALIHHHYDSISQFVLRLDRYTDHQLKNLTKKFVWTDLISKPASEFISQYFSRQGYRDGLHGLALSGLQAFSEFVLYLKLWQQSGFPSRKVDPKDIDVLLDQHSREWRWWMYESRIGLSGGVRRLLLKLARKIGI